MRGYVTVMMAERQACLDDLAAHGFTPVHPQVRRAVWAGSMSGAVPFGWSAARAAPVRLQGNRWLWHHAGDSRPWLALSGAFTRLCLHARVCAGRPGSSRQSVRSVRTRSPVCGLSGLDRLRASVSLAPGRWLWHGLILTIW
jgi:hypothetical protein